jgi:hypothetical protein
MPEKTRLRGLINFFMWVLGLVVVVGMVSISGGGSSYTNCDSNSGTQKFFTASSRAVPIQMEKKTIPIVHIQKSHALSQESTHSSKFIAAPTSFVLLPSGSLGSGYTCYTRCNMLRWWLYNACKMYTLLTPVLVLFICCCDQVKGHICKGCDH